MNKQLKAMYPEGYSEEQKNKVIFQYQKALEMLTHLENNTIIGTTYKLDPNSLESQCGLTLKEIVAISYQSLENKEDWINPEQAEEHKWQDVSQENQESQQSASNLAEIDRISQRLAEVVKLEDVRGATPQAPTSTPASKPLVGPTRG